MKYLIAIALLILGILILLAIPGHATECLPSARAVWQQHPGSHATWRLRLPGYEGTKCWFAASRVAQRGKSAGHTRPGVAGSNPVAATIPLPRPRLDWEILHPERYDRASPAEGR